MLRGSQEQNGRIQIPVNLPKSFTVHAQVERTGGEYAFGFIFPVGGVCTAVRIDAENGTKTGIDAFKDFSFVDKAVNQSGRSLEYGKAVDVQLQVTPKSFQLMVDGKSALKWEGDLTEFQLPEELSVSNSNWLHLIGDSSRFRIRELTISPNE